MNDITDTMLGAYVDGELDEAERARIGEAIETDPALRRRVEAERALRATLRAHYAPVTDEPIPASLRSRLEPAPAQVVDLAAARARRRFAWPHYGAMAASLAVGMLGGQLLLRQAPSPVAMESGELVARGPLADALDTQLASVRAEGRTTRIGLTFEDDAGRYCRTFDSGAVSGIGCREGDSWRLVATAAGGGTTREYRQASAPAVLEQAEAMMAGPPLDAAAERRVRDRNWRRD
jgi:hypothetical protein